MARTVEAVLPPDRARPAVEKLTGLEGVVGIHLLGEISLVPGGSVVALTTTNEGARSAVRILVDEGAVSIVTSEPVAVSTPQQQAVVEGEGDEALWDEVSTLLRRQSGPSFNLMSLMALAGAFAGVGLWLDRIHVIVAGMIVAPGFVPLLRMPFGLLVGPRSHLRSGPAALGIGYAALALAAALVYGILEATGDRGAIEDREWVSFFTTISVAAVVLSVAAAAAGAIVMTSGREVLTAGVMVALALVPSAALVGIGLVAAEIDLAGRALARWAVDAALVTAIGGGVFAAKHALVHRGRSLADRGDA